MFFAEMIRQIVEAGTQQLITWVTQILPQVFLFLIFLNAVTRLIGQSRVERIAARCGSNSLLRYLVLPFLSAVVLGNPMAISMGRYLPEEYKPAYFASASFHCHTNSGIFQHVNPAELFLWLGIANGVLAQRLDVFPLAFRYLLAGLAANYLSGLATEIITRRLEKKQQIQLESKVDLHAGTGSELQNFPAPHPETDPGFSGGSPRRPAVDPPGNIPRAYRTKPLTNLTNLKNLKNTINTEADTDQPYRSITITRGDGGYGGPLTITPTQDRHIVLYMTGGGKEPEPLARIVSLSGMTAVNGNQETCPDEEVALAIIDCGGTLRCGIFPGKGIPTVNLLATGRSGPLAKYMTEDLYVSAVTSAQVSPAYSGEEADAAFFEEGTASASDPASLSGQDGLPGPAGTPGAPGPVTTVSRIISVFHQSARDAVRTCLEMLLPFMGFAALFVGICRGSGLTQLLAGLMEPMGGSLPGLFLIGFLCSLPGLSAVLGAGAVAAQMFATVIGDLIAAGSIAPAMALPALFAINCQCACDFIPVGLGMMEAKPETTQIGVAAVTLSRFATGWIRIIIALLFTIGLYAG